MASKTCQNGHAELAKELAHLVQDGRPKNGPTPSDPSSAPNPRRLLLLRHVPSKVTAATGALLLFAAGFIVSHATGASAGVPADKPFAAASKTVKFAANNTTQRTELMRAIVHNSKTSDIVLMLSMECSIVTDVVIAGSSTPGTSESATTDGSVRAWVEIDGAKVPII